MLDRRDIKINDKPIFSSRALEARTRKIVHCLLFCDITLMKNNNMYSLYLLM